MRQLLFCEINAKVREEKLASWKKLSAVSQASSNPDTMEVQMQRSYHLNDDDDTEVEKENVAQGIKTNFPLILLIFSFKYDCCNLTICSWF